MTTTATSDNELSGHDAAAGSVALVRLQYAVKTALSLTLAYLIPMALGWPQPQTAATTVMLIAATGMVSESLRKGVLRVMGTVVGCVLGLTLIALHPQDRVVYLMAASLVVAFIIYLYNAYQGDNTMFMLTAVVTLMVFNGGDAQGAFLFGLDRAFMTAFGVIVYTVIASMLWPVKIADNTRELATTMCANYRSAFNLLIRENAASQDEKDQLLAALLADEETFQSQFAIAKNDADGISDYLPEWNVILSCYEKLDGLLVPALKRQDQASLDFRLFIDNYDSVVNNVESLYEEVTSLWQGHQSDTAQEALVIAFNIETLRQRSHMEAAAIATRAEVLEETQRQLTALRAALNSLLFDQRSKLEKRQPRGKPTFVWLDWENVKTAIRTFFTFWIATAIWILFNPPGGFTFVTMCTILIPLVSYTPVTPKLLFILLSLGFAFALPAYVFLLPHMSHWLELALFLFSYGFIGFYVFQGPVSIFFLLGLFTLGIQNTMNYHIDAIALSMVMFYLVCATLIISVHFPFTSKPEALYASLCRRFFHHCGRSLELSTKPPSCGRRYSQVLLGSGAPLLAKMAVWGAKIDPNYFRRNTPEKIGALNQNCEFLYGQLHALSLRSQSFERNRLITLARQQSTDAPLIKMCRALAEGGSDVLFEQVPVDLSSIEAKLDELLGTDYLDKFKKSELAEFYIYLHLQASIYQTLNACRLTQHALDWRQLDESRF